MTFFAASAQSKFSLGPNAGFGATWISNFESSKYQPAGNVGVSLIYSALEHFGIGADLKYSIEGGKRNYSVGTTAFTQTLRADYLRIPVKAIYFFNDRGDRLRPKVAIGPSFGFRIGGKNELETMPASGTATVSKSDIKNVYKDFDLGLQGSAGINYRLVSKTWLNLGLAYTHGLINNAVNTSSNLKNRNLQLEVGVNFGL